MARERGVMLLQGDCLEKLRDLADNSVDSIVTDPPYGLSFMGKHWDYDVPQVEVWAECLRVLKPGGHLLAFFGTRTYHRGVVRIEDAGFEIRDQIQWIYSTGFPKSLNVQKAALKVGQCCGCKKNSEHDMRSLRNSDLSETINPENESGQVLQPSLSKQSPSEYRPERCPVIQGSESLLEGRKLHRTRKGLSNDSNAESSACEKERLRIGAYSCSGEDVKSLTDNNGSCPSYKSQSGRQSPRKSKSLQKSHGTLDGTPFQRCPNCARPIIPEGYGSALKPANEPIVVARKPLEKGLTLAENVLKWGTGALNIDGSRIGDFSNNTPSGLQRYREWSDSHTGQERPEKSAIVNQAQGRWPANVIFDEDAAAVLDEQSGTLKSGKPGIKRQGNNGAAYGVESRPPGTQMSGFGDSGGASRFFYVAKASKRERNAGLEGMPLSSAPKNGAEKRITVGGSKDVALERQNHHPTVKPIKLMEYLVALVTPLNGSVLDPFMGSGSTGVAAKNLNREFIGIELSEEYFEIAKKRIG